MMMSEHQVTAFQDSPVLSMKSPDRPWWLVYAGGQYVRAVADNSLGTPTEFGAFGINSESPTVAEAVERMLTVWTDDSVRDWYRDEREHGVLS